MLIDKIKKMIQQTNQKYTPRTNKVSYKIVYIKNYNLWMKIILFCYSLFDSWDYVCGMHDTYKYIWLRLNKMDSPPQLVYSRCIKNNIWTLQESQHGNRREIFHSQSNTGFF